MNVHEIMEILIKRGLNPNHRNVKGETPLDYFKNPKYQRLYILLRDYGGKFSAELARS